MSLVELTSAIITQIPDDKEAVAFVEKMLPKVADHKEASVYCRVLIAQVCAGALGFFAVGQFAIKKNLTQPNLT